MSMPARLRVASVVLQALLPKPGQARFHRRVNQADALAATLHLVPPRLREIREARHLTLAELSARTGISKSTLSRLETGQRRPTLELLLQLALTYRVPLDDLVGAPD